MNQMQKRLVRTCWTPQLEALLEDTIATSRSLRELFQRHPEKRDEYKFKVLDAGPWEPFTSAPRRHPATAQCQACRFRAFTDEATGETWDWDQTPNCAVYASGWGKPDGIYFGGDPCPFFEEAR